MRQEIPGLGTNYMRYSYDLLSGNMLELAYNEKWKDQFFHRYFYDEDNRLVEVKTSRDRVLWESDARYYYYLHGPLRRAEYGEDSLQGVDYVHTIHGWLKAINHPRLDWSDNDAADPGRDGHASFGHEDYAYDAFGMMLTYYEGDFNRVNSPYNSHASNGLAGTQAYHLLPVTSLYNGNITSWTSHIQASATATDFDTLTGHTYSYDVLNRLLSASFKERESSSWSNAGGYFNTSYSYDANGNIQRLKRNGSQSNAGGVLMDSLIYSYPTSSSRLQNRRLQQVNDGVGSTVYANDIDDQGSSTNYTYDQTGNLITDASEGITNIDWSIYGKVRRVTKSSGMTLGFLYDGAGNRVRKQHRTADGDTATTFYVYEAGGKVLAIYQRSPAPVSGGGGPLDSDSDGIPDASDNCPCVFNPGQPDSDSDGYGNSCDPVGPTPPIRDSDSDGIPDVNDDCICDDDPECAPEVEEEQQTVMAEWLIYGNTSDGRFATVKPAGVGRQELTGDTIEESREVFARKLDEKVYELKDHLGNVRVVLSDVKLNGGAPDAQSGRRPYMADLRSYG